MAQGLSYYGQDPPQKSQLIQEPKDPLQIARKGLKTKQVDKFQAMVDFSINKMMTHQLLVERCRAEMPILGISQIKYKSGRTLQFY